LQRAFHVAGTHNVIASLWKVDDDATAALMTLFYSKLWAEKQPLPPLAALREAQLTIYRHPELIPELAKVRGPLLGSRVKLPKEEPVQPRPREKTANPRLWAAFVFSGTGR
jgi:CHAT domain-containing protein